ALRQLAQGPSDGLADEEVLAVGVGVDGEGEQVAVGGLLVTDLADDRGTSLPQVAVGGPYPHDRRHCGGLGAQKRTNPPDRDLIDVVPPRPGRHKLGVKPADKVDVLVGRIGAVDAQCDGGIALLAVSCGAPEQLDGAQPGRSIWQLMIDKYDLEQRLLAGRGNAVEG